jgi:hypothetical protein
VELRWDVYECENKHLIIVEHKKEWPDYVQYYFECDICRRLAYYLYSVESLKEVEKE